MVLKKLVSVIKNCSRLQRRCLLLNQVCRRSSSACQYRKMDQTVITKSLNDKREYRLVVLENGLRALLISDLDGQDQSSFVDENQSESEEESDCSEASESEDEEEDIDMAEAVEKPGQGEKKSAVALCVGVGSFSDPDDIPGFAHFLEHMVFMGSEKYPEVNSLDDYISKHGGETNAWTDNEKTCFYFDVERKYFRKALDKFAHFFAGPLLLKDWVDKEIEAVDSEYQERLPCDLTRIEQLLYSTAKLGHPMAKFLFGNSDTLKHSPATRGIDVYGRLRDFFNRNYSAQYMTLAVHSRHSLNTLEDWVTESFSGIHNNKAAQPSFKELKDPFDTEDFRKFYKVIPVENAHKLILTWAFQPSQHLYKQKPLEYISSLVTHEGKGSILAYLKKKNWAVELTGGNTGSDLDNNSTCSEFDVNITLTDSGLQNYHSVISTVFEYLAMLRQVGPLEWFYEELQTIETSTFRWKEQGDPTEYVEKVCVNMQNYTPEDYLTGHRLYRQYDAKLIGECLEYLRADNCNMMLVSSDFTESDCPEKEHWFRAQYSAQDPDSAYLQEWKDPKKNVDLFMPEPNEFIATDFTLKTAKVGEQSLLPVQLMSTPHCRLFYKKDNKFNVPKGIVYVHLQNTVVKESAKNLALLGLFAIILNQNLSESVYPAALAGYTVEMNIDEHQSGVVLEISGFNHKLQNVLNKVIDAIKEFTCTDKQFEALRAQLKKEYYNDLIKPQEVAFMVRQAIIKQTYWTRHERYTAVDSLTKAHLMSLVRTFLDKLHMDCFVFGNFTTQEARDICETVCDKLKGVCLDEDALMPKTMLEIPVGKLYCQVPGFNPADVNSCITNYYQSGPRTLEKSCLNEVLVKRMYEPCFNTLRTKHQLGYTVYTQNYDTNGIIGLGIIVEFQQNKFSMSHVDQHIENFLEEFKDTLMTMTQEEFDDLIESVVTLKKVEDTHLGEEAGRHWREIDEQTYLFDRRHREIAILKTLTLESLRDWFMQYFEDNQRKLSIQVVGTKTEDGAIASPAKHLADHELPIRYLVDPEQRHSTAVEDVLGFKNSLKQWPPIKHGS